MEYINIRPPLEDEYPAYAGLYINLVPTDGFLLEYMMDSLVKTKELLLTLTENELLYRYTDLKWTIKELIVHIIDDERIYAYRALCFARNEKKNLPGFDQDKYTLYANANSRSIDNIINEYEAVRKSTVALFNGLSPHAFDRYGIANGNRATVRGLAYHIAGHELHHLKILKEKYLINRTFS